jgi:hypothetical protein
MQDRDKTRENSPRTVRMAHGLSVSLVTIEVVFAQRELNLLLLLQ